MKKSLLSMAAALAVTASAMAYDDVAVTYSWALGDESEAVASGEEAAAALLESGVKVGTDLAVGSRSYTLDDVSYGPYPSYRPETSNAGCVETDMIEYSIKLKKGITFTPTSVSFDAIKVGTDNVYFSWSYTVDDVEAEPIGYTSPKTQIRRNNNANPEAPINHEEAITAEGGRTFTFRIYMSNVTNNKEVLIGNVKLNGKLNGTEDARSFVNFKLDFRPEEAVKVVLPESGELPAGVAIVGGKWHDGQHGYQDGVVTVDVDGPVRFTIAGCQYSNQATITDAEGNLLATLDTRSAGCDNTTGYDHFVTWTYNSETPTTLTISLGSYCPFLFAEACDLIPYCTLRYYDTDGKTLIAEEEVEGGSPLTFTHGADDVTVAEGYKFRGWYNSTLSSSQKFVEGTSVQDNLNLYAWATEIEVPTNTSRYIYELNKTNFYIEDHEAIWNNGGSFHDGQHGWAFSAGNSLTIAVAGNSIVSIGNCLYSSDTEATVTNKAGEVVATFNVKAESDGAEFGFQYASAEPDELTITFGGVTYVHKVTVYNVVEFVKYDEATGYYMIPAGDANSFLLALASANGTGNAKIYLPNGVYDLGQLCLTAISGNNISIIGESMEGTIIRNAPLVENEGIGTTATLLNTSTGLYLQDLTLQNALDYYKSGSAGRAVCLQDKGANTICKNVRLLSYQDTYYSNRASNFYWEDSEIHGTVDYLCGDGNVVYNRLKFVNESRSANDKSGSDVLCAPYNTATTSDRFNWGYVFLDCSIESQSKDFTFARSWGGESKATFIRTTILDGSLAASRWTAAGMNVAASGFKEYKTMDAAGNVTTPESNVVTFTHTTGDKTYETVLTDAEAAQYTIENIYGEWAPDQIAAQVEVTDEAVAGGLSNVAPAFIITSEMSDGSVETGIYASGAAEAIDGSDITVDNIVDFFNNYGELYGYKSLTLRAANGRGGFGPARTYVSGPVVAIDAIEAAEAPAAVYDLNGRRVAAPQAGQLYVKSGSKFIAR